MWAFQFQMRPLLSLEDARIPVPCQEVLWEAESSLDWQQLYDSSTREFAHVSLFDMSSQRHQRVHLSTPQSS